jgi:hypothetical protein
MSGTVVPPDLGDFLAALSERPVQNTPVRIASSPLDSIAFHDFSYHEYVLPTDVGFARYSLSESGLSYMSTIQQSTGGSAGTAAPSLPAGVYQEISRVVFAVEAGIRRAVYQTVFPVPAHPFFYEYKTWGMRYGPYTTLEEALNRLFYDVYADGGLAGVLDLIARTGAGVELVERAAYLAYLAMAARWGRYATPTHRQSTGRQPAPRGEGPQIPQDHASQSQKLVLSFGSLDYQSL